MAKNLTQKLIESHLVSGRVELGAEIGLKIDQTLTQDATGTLVMLELESIKLDRVQTELSAQYVDHNLVQQDFKNADDHLFLRSACQRFGIWYSPPGNGVSHPVHQERFGRPGKTLLGSDSHTPSAGALGMLAIGAGGLEVAMAMAGEPFFMPMPRVWVVELVGEMPPWVSAKDVILEMLRRHDVKGMVGYVLEYRGEGLESLSAMDRHVIANMGAELGATSTIFPSDDEVRRFMRCQGRDDVWYELLADPGSKGEGGEQLDLSALDPLIAMPASPGNVKRVRDVAGEEIYQAYIGSSANPGYRDFAVAAEIVKGRQIHDRVSFDVNPTSRQILENLARDGHLQSLIHAGARIHQAGCNGCIGMGQAPATDKISLRTVPRNFPGRSGTREDKVCLVSPETAAASALTGVITDPRELDRPYPRVREPDHPVVNESMLVPPLLPEQSRSVEMVKGPNITSIPELDETPDGLTLPVLLKMGDNISTDEIMPAGARVLPYRSNIEKISEFAFDIIDSTYHDRAAAVRDSGGHAVVAGWNYGQGSSREHAALAPRHLGLRLVLAKGFARIHWQNLVNFGILPLEVSDAGDYDSINQGDNLRVTGLRKQSRRPVDVIIVRNLTRDAEYKTTHSLSSRQLEVLLAGGLMNWVRVHKAIGTGKT